MRTRPGPLGPRVTRAHGVKQPVLGYVARMGQADEGLAEDFAAIARLLQAETTPELTQERITRTAVDAIGGCDHAAISLILRRGGVHTVAATDDVAVAGGRDPVRHRAGSVPGRAVGTRDLRDRRPGHATSAGRRSAAGRSRRPGCAACCRSSSSCRATPSARSTCTPGEPRRSICTAAPSARCWPPTPRSRSPPPGSGSTSQHLEEALRSNREIGIAMGVLMASRRADRGRGVRRAAAGVAVPQPQAARGRHPGRGDRPPARTARPPDLNARPPRNSATVNSRPARLSLQRTPADPREGGPCAAHDHVPARVRANGRSRTGTSTSPRCSPSGRRCPKGILAGAVCGTTWSAATSPSRTTSPAGTATAGRTPTTWSRSRGSG